MNLQETLQLLDRLGSLGAKHFKSQDFEVHLANTTSVVREIPVTTNVVPPEEPINQENTKKVQDIIDLLHSKDEEILNRVFPEGA